MALELYFFFLFLAGFENAKNPQAFQNTDL